MATWAINRGMSLKAIAAMLGHRSMDITLRYAKTRAGMAAVDRGELHPDSPEDPLGGDP